MSRLRFADPADPPSPCIKLCQLDPVSRRCTGCLRTLEEIGGWSIMSPEEKQAVIDALPSRKPQGRRRR